MSWPFDTSQPFITPAQAFGQEWKAAFGHPTYLEALLRVADVAVDVAASLGQTAVHP